MYKPLKHMLHIVIWNIPAQVSLASLSWTILSVVEKIAPRDSPPPHTYKTSHNPITATPCAEKIRIKLTANPSRQQNPSFLLALTQSGGLNSRHGSPVDCRQLYSHLRYIKITNDRSWKDVHVSLEFSCTRPYLMTRFWSALLMQDLDCIET